MKIADSQILPAASEEQYRDSAVRAVFDLIQAEDSEGLNALLKRMATDSFETMRYGFVTEFSHILDKTAKAGMSDYIVRALAPLMSIRVIDNPKDKPLHEFCDTLMYDLVRKMKVSYVSRSSMRYTGTIMNDYPAMTRIALKYGPFYTDWPEQAAGILAHLSEAMGVFQDSPELRRKLYNSIIQSGADLNHEVPRPYRPVELPLKVAIVSGNRVMVEEILNAANFDKKLCVSQYPDLLCAVADIQNSRLNASFIINQLINVGYDINAEHQGKTPLITAVEKKNATVCELLIAAGADVNYMNSEGYSALAVAKNTKSAKIEECLEKYGASTKHKGFNASEARVARLLKDKGADRESIIQGVKKEIESGKIRPNATECFERNCVSLLEMAVIYGADAGVVKLLLDAGADPNYRDMNRHRAVEYLFVGYCQPYTSKFAVEKKIDFENACKTLKHLVAAGADLHEYLSDCQRNTGINKLTTSISVYTIYDALLNAMEDNLYRLDDIARQQLFDLKDARESIFIPGIAVIAQELIARKEDVICEITNLLLTCLGNTPTNEQREVLQNYMKSLSRYGLPSVLETILSHKTMRGYDNNIPTIVVTNKSITPLVRSSNRGNGAYLNAMALPSINGMSSIIQPLVRSKTVNSAIETVLNNNGNSSNIWNAIVAKQIAVQEFVFQGLCDRMVSQVDILLKHRVPLDKKCEKYFPCTYDQYVKYIDAERYSSIKDIVNVVRKNISSHIMAKWQEPQTGKCLDKISEAVERLSISRANDSMSSTEIMEGFEL